MQPHQGTSIHKHKITNTSFNISLSHRKRNVPHVRKKLEADAKELRDAAITRIKRQMEQLQVSPARKVATKRMKPIKERWTATPLESVEQIFDVMKAEEVLPSDLGIKETIGKKRGLMWPRGHALKHPAMELLMEYAEKGCPVDCGRDWTVEEIEAALLHGPHKSAKSPEAAAALRDETLQKVKNGYAKIVRYGDIRHRLPKNLKISPCACIPHKSRKFRVILDLSFALQMESHRVPSVNEATTPLSKEASMAQLGSTIKRIVQTMAENFDKSKPFVFSKLDIKDGFWRLCVSEEDAWNFAYVLPAENPTNSIDDIQIVVPDALQMGWCESPPFFCTASETARDVIQELWETGTVLEEHPLECRMKYMDVTESCPSSPATLIEVYVDDYIGITNDISCEKLQRLSRCMLHGIHSIFPPPDVTGHDGEDSIAEKKIDKGEGIWAQEKEILGWIFNGKEYTIQLPPTKCDTIMDNIAKILKLKRTVPRNLLESILGKLQHASFGVPGSRGMLSPLQEALTKPKPFIPLTKLLKQCLQSWIPIVKHMKQHPTSVMLLVKTPPEYIGYSDACGIGAGGVWTSGTKGIRPVVWQVEWTNEIKEAFQKGILTINDLELAGLVLEWMALECLLPSLVGVHVAAFCDNTSAVSWSNKLATSTSRAAARLLGRLGMSILESKASPLMTLSIEGEHNDMADVSSRAFKEGKYHAAAADLVSYFNTHFPLPSQKDSWIELKIPSKWQQRVMSCLLGEQSMQELLQPLQRHVRNIGQHGVDIAQNGTKTHIFKDLNHWKQRSLSQPLLQGSGLVSTEEEMKSKFHRCVTQSQQSPRPSNWLENKFHSKRRKTSHSRSKEC